MTTYKRLFVALMALSSLTACMEQLIMTDGKTPIMPVFKQ